LYEQMFGKYKSVLLIIGRRKVINLRHSEFKDIPIKEIKLYTGFDLIIVIQRENCLGYVCLL